MPMLNRCCCTKNFRTGVIAAGVWTLLYCVLSMGMTIDSMYARDDPMTPSPRQKNELRESVMEWISLSTSFLACLSVILLIVGVLKNKSWMLLPWIVTIAVVTVLDAASIIEGIMTDGFSKLLIAILLVWITITLINIYCELCVLSHYQELKIGRGRLRDYMGDKYRRRYIPEVQHVHIGDVPLAAPTNQHTVYSPPTNQHTVYSFRSQSLYEGELEQSAVTEAGTVELRPLSPASVNVNIRKADDIPLIIKQRSGSGNHTGSMEITPNPHTGSGSRPRRFRTQSDSAVREPVIHEDNAVCEVIVSPEVNDKSPLTQYEQSATDK